MKDKKTIILGLEDVLAKLSLDEIANYDKTFELSQNGLTLGTVLSLVNLVIRQVATILNGILELPCEKVWTDSFL